ncbi:MAG TPA: S1/P1 nuclease [Polyangia bacterium]|nr:S1/P1 nuclease [Polyangia bacterium]
MNLRAVVLVVGVVAFTGVVASPPAFAWDDFGHMEVAAVAYPKLNAKAKKKVAALLKLNPRYALWVSGVKAADAERVAFMRAATWADSIKSDAGYKDDQQTAPTAGQNVGYTDKLKHAYWHFVDQPYAADATPGAAALAPNALTQIGLLRAALATAATTDDVKSYDLVWLLHLVGDVHQPLHCVSRYDVADPKGDRGGNNVLITNAAQPAVCDDPRYCPFGPPNELHAFFDDIEGAGYAVEPPYVAAGKLAKADKTKAAIADENVWVAEGLELAKTAVYVAPIGLGDGPFAIDAAYQAAAEKLGRARIALAGARLANLINDALGK